MKKFEFAFDDFSGGMDGKKFGGISAKSAEICFNTDGEYGAFKQGLGFDLPSINASVFMPPAKQICCFCMDGQDFLAHVDQSGKLSVLSFDTNEWRNVMATSGKTKLLPYRQNQKMILLIFDDSGLHEWDGANVSTLCEQPVLDDVVIYAERVFGIDLQDKTLLRFCEHLNPSNWTNSQEQIGFIRLDDNFGKIAKIAVLDNLLFVFGEQKIAKIQATSSPENFFVQKLYCLNGKIQKDTIQVCGDQIVFLCDDGLYVFDGNKTEKICEQLQNHFESSLSNSCFFGAKYYLACKMDFFDGRRIGCENDVFENNVLFEYDLQKQKHKISRGVDLSQLSATKDKLFFVSNNQVGQVSDSGNFFGKPMQKVWETAYGDFGISSKKVIKSVQLHTLTNMVLKICADNKSYTFCINGKKGLQKLKLGIPGNMFKICFETTSSKPFVFKPIFEIGYGG